MFFRQTLDEEDHTRLCEMVAANVDAYVADPNSNLFHDADHLRHILFEFSDDRRMLGYWRRFGIYYYGSTYENNLMLWLCEYDNVPRGEEMLRALFKREDTSHEVALIILADRGRHDLVVELNKTTKPAATVYLLCPPLTSSFRQVFADYSKYELAHIDVADVCLVTHDNEQLFLEEIADLSQKELNLLLYNAMWRQADPSYVKILLDKGADPFTASSSTDQEEDDIETILDASMAFITPEAFKLVLESTTDKMKVYEAATAVLSRLRDRWVMVSRPELLPPVSELTRDEVKRLIRRALDHKATETVWKLVDAVI
jgi:hypothetical protein